MSMNASVSKNGYRHSIAGLSPVDSRSRLVGAAVSHGGGHLRRSSISTDGILLSSCRGAQFANRVFDARELSVRVGDLGVRVAVEPVRQVAQLVVQVSVQPPVR